MGSPSPVQDPKLPPPGGDNHRLSPAATKALFLSSALKVTTCSKYLGDLGTQVPPTSSKACAPISYILVWDQQEC